MQKLLGGTYIILALCNCVSRVVTCIWECSCVVCPFHRQRRLYNVFFLFGNRIPENIITPLIHRSGGNPEIERTCGQAFLQQQIYT